MAAPSIKSSGTQTVVISTEHTLAVTADPGFYEAQLDTGAMLAGDTTLLRLKTNVLDAGTVRDIDRATYSGAAAEPMIKRLGPYALPRGCTVTLTQSAGTARS